MAAEGDLVKLAAVKSWLNLKLTEFDADLARLISGCSAAMQRYMERTIGQQDYHHRMNGPGAEFITVPNYPIARVSTVTVDGVAMPKSGVSFDGRVIYLAGGQRFARGRMNVELRYTAGFDVVPPDLVQACIDTVSLRWRERDRIGMSSKGLAGETTTFTLADFPKQVITLMDSYKNRVPM